MSIEERAYNGIAPSDGAASTGRPERAIGVDCG
jgi:hypothetical protein